MGNIARAAIVENLDLGEDWDILSIDLNEPDSDAICSLSEGEIGSAQKVTTELGDKPFETAYMVTSEELTWRKQPNFPQEMKECPHHWEDNTEVPRGREHCKCCGEMTNSKMRAFCSKCELTVCPMCSRFVLGRKIKIETQRISPYDSKDRLISELLGYINFLLAENERLKLQLMEKSLAKEADELELVDQEKLRKGKGILMEEDNEEEDEEEELSKEFSSLNLNPSLIIRESTDKP